jgi:hypothetical protein
MQQINLYQPELRPRRVPLRATSMAAITVIVMLALGALYVYAWWQVKPLDRRLVVARAAVEAAEARLQALRAAHPPATLDSALRDEVARKRGLLEATRAVADRLASGGFGSVEGLSAYLVGLSRQHREGSWLTSFAVEEGGAAVSLGGRALAPELVPAYLARLSAEQRFRGKTFNVMRLTAVGEEAPGEVDFAVQTRAKPVTDERS